MGWHTPRTETMPGRGHDSMSVSTTYQVHPDGARMSPLPGGTWGLECRSQSLFPGFHRRLQHPHTPTWQPLVTADPGIRAARLRGVPGRGRGLPFAGEAPLVTVEEERCAALGWDESLRTPRCCLGSQQALCAAFVCCVSFRPGFRKRRSLSRVMPYSSAKEPGAKVGWGTLEGWTGLLRSPGSGLG